MPQIELMQSDLPHTLYNRKKNDGKKRVVEDENAIRLNEESLRKAMERRRRQMEAESEERDSYTINELFEGKAD